MNDPFVQEDGETLKNRLGIVADPDELRFQEREYSRLRAETVHEDVSGAFDGEHLRAIHNHLFQDIYEWAGTTRGDKITLEGEQVNVPAMLPELSKGGSDFAASVYVERGLQAISASANSDAALSSDPAEFAVAAAGVLSALNYVHPFREGNGRTQRAFLEQMAERAGHQLDFEGVTAERMTEASIEAMNDNPAPFREIIAESLDAERVALRLQAIAALERSGVEADNFWVETAAEGARVQGVVLEREARHLSVVNDDNHFIALPLSEQTETLKPGEAVDFVLEAGPERALETRSEGFDLEL